MNQTRSIEHLCSYAIVDGARAGKEIELLKDSAIEWQSLFRDPADRDLEAVAPHLMRCSGADRFFAAYSDRGWGKSWGIFLASQASNDQISRHLRKFLRVKDEEGRQLYFRFYDPRVLRIFLPTCSIAQLNELFGPVDHFVVEHEDPRNAIIFSIEKQALRQDVVDLTGDNVGLPALPKRSQTTQESQLIV